MKKNDNSGVRDGSLCHLVIMNTYISVTVSESPMIRTECSVIVTEFSESTSYLEIIDSSPKIEDKMSTDGEVVESSTHTDLNANSACDFSKTTSVIIVLAISSVISYVAIAVVCAKHHRRAKKTTGQEIGRMRNVSNISMSTRFLNRKIRFGRRGSVPPHSPGGSGPDNPRVEQGALQVGTACHVAYDTIDPSTTLDEERGEECRGKSSPQACENEGYIELQEAMSKDGYMYINEYTACPKPVYMEISKDVSGSTEDAVV